MPISADLCFKVTTSLGVASVQICSEKGGPMSKFRIPDIGQYDDHRETKAKERSPAREPSWCELGNR